MAKPSFLALSMDKRRRSSDVISELRPVLDVAEADEGVVAFDLGLTTLAWAAAAPLALSALASAMIFRMASRLFLISSALVDEDLAAVVAVVGLRGAGLAAGLAAGVVFAGFGGFGTTGDGT